MSYRSKRSRNARTSKVKDTTIQSVEDILSKVIQDVAAGEAQASDNLLNLSCNQTDQVAHVTNHSPQGTIAEADDFVSNRRNTSRKHTPSPSQSLAADPPRQLRSSLRHSHGHQGSDFQLVHEAADEGLQDLENSAWQEHEAEDIPMTEQAEATTMEQNDATTNKGNTSGGQNLKHTVSQQFPVDPPSQFRASKRPPAWVQDGSEPAEEDFQVGHAKPPKWSDDIAFDEMEEVEMRDLDGKRGRKGGRVLPRHVWSLQPGIRFVVPFNALDQPIRKGGHILIKFLGDVAKNGELIPLGEESWPKMDKSRKADVITLVREKFVLPEREEINKDVLKHVASKWRVYRYRLKQKYKKPGKTQEQVASVVPKGVIPSQWAKLVNYWFSDKSQYLSTLGREARATQVHFHTTGSKSFARMRDEFEMVHGREPGALEWFDQTHRRKDGTYVENTSKEFLDTAAMMIAERGAPSSSKERIAVENKVFSELMYSDDDHRPIGYGFGVNRNKVSGVGAELRKRGYMPSGVFSEAAGVTRNKMPRIGIEGGKSVKVEPDMSAEMERLNLAIEAISETNELMQVQLKMQSKQLKMQSQQLQRQSQQMEGLHFQLQQVSSLVTKFGVKKNKPPVKPTPISSRYWGMNIPNAQETPASHGFIDGDDSESSAWDSD